MYSAYVQDEWKVFNNFVLNYGLRFDQLDSYRKENQLSPRINFVWTPLPGTTVHGGYSRYFTPPPFELVNNETLSKYYGTVNYPYALAANPKQKLDTTPYSERDNYFDLGIQQKVTKHLTVGLDGYDRYAHNLIDEGQFGEAVILTPYNYQTGWIYGAEFTTQYNQGPFSAYWNLAYSHDQGKDIESSQFNFQPDELAYIANHYIYLDHEEIWSSSFGASYRWHATTVSLDGIYGSGLRAHTAPTWSRTASPCRPTRCSTSRSCSTSTSSRPPGRSTCASTSSTCSTRRMRSATAPASAWASPSGAPAADSSSACRRSSEALRRATASPATLCTGGWLRSRPKSRPPDRMG